MARTLSSSIAVAALVAVTPFALHAQDASRTQNGQTPPNGMAVFSAGITDQSDVRVINLKVDPARNDSASKADKAKNDRKKKNNAKAKASSAGLQAEDRDEGQDQTWSTEFLVDHEKDHTTDPIPPANTK